MIELIFAIVIIAIVVISMPMMMKTNQDAVEGNVVQEALFASSAKMMQVLSYPWDEHSVDSANPNTYGKVVYVGAGDNSYYRKDANGSFDANSSYRVGHILQDNHRRFHDYSSVDANVSAINVDDNSSIDAIDDRNESGRHFDFAGGSAGGYKNDYTMDVDVSYISDASTTTGSSNAFNFSIISPPGASNMKLITVTIKDKNGNPLTLLRSYSANIGEFDFAKRRF
jgi:Tfp pilus assembly protein PilV